ncbi:MAG: hypothetical protein ACK5QH_08940 [Rubrivivax sp.]
MSRDTPHIQPTLLKPWEVVHPHTGQGHAWQRVTGCNRHAGLASAADLRPPVQRPGSEDFLACPSRVGETLRYRDGRVTDLAGNPLSPSTHPGAHHDH